MHLSILSILSLHKLLHYVSLHYVLSSCIDRYMSRRSKPKTRLQQLREKIVKMGGEDVSTRFETLQLHAGELSGFTVL